MRTIAIPESNPLTKVADVVAVTELDASEIPPPSARLKRYLASDLNLKPSDHKSLRAVSASAAEAGLLSAEDERDERSVQYLHDALEVARGRITVRQFEAQYGKGTWTALTNPTGNWIWGVTQAGGGISALLGLNDFRRNSVRRKQASEGSIAHNPRELQQRRVVTQSSVGTAQFLARYALDALKFPSLVLGVALVVTGVLNSILSLIGSITWFGGLSGLASRLENAAPGAAVFILGVLVILATWMRRRAIEPEPHPGRTGRDVD